MQQDDKTKSEVDGQFNLEGDRPPNMAKTVTEGCQLEVIWCIENGPSVLLNNNNGVSSKECKQPQRVLFRVFKKRRRFKQQQLNPTR